jgi:hypothetical protein
VLEAFDTVKCLGGLHTDELNRSVIAQVLAGSHQRSRRPQSRHEMREFARGLRPELRTGRHEVGGDVGRVVVLIRIEVPV